MSVVVAEPPVTLVTIPNIELVSVGQWEAMTGPVEFTMADLEAMVAALSDPAVHDPRLRIGHTGPVTAEESAGGFEEQPAFGRFVNARIEGSSIFADAAGVPGWLADILPAAFPSRSVEVYWDVKTAAGRVHPAVLTSVALLGVSMPAVETLEDLKLAFGAETPEGVTFTYSGKVAASKGEAMPERVAASVASDDVRSSFWNDFAQDEYYWWWLCELYVSPTVVIADDDEGGYWSVPYTVSGDTVTWGEPVQVKRQYVEVEGGKVAASATARTTPVVFASAALSRPTDRVRAAKTEGASMTDEHRKTLASKLGLAADATVEQINAKLQEDALADEPEADETPDEGDETPETDETSDDPESPQGVVVDQAALAALREDARLGREAREEQLSTERKAYVAAAVKAGKFPPTSVPSYLAQLERGGEVEKATRQFIDKLAAGVVPVTELGHAPEPGAQGTEPEWFQQFPSPNRKEA